jgi:Ca-activated chloride channel family protein
MFFKSHGINPFYDADLDNLSTFALDVDTGSYTVVRSYLGRGHLPPEAAVRVEEFVNFFDYLYHPPKSGAFAVHLEGAPSADREEYTLLRVGIKAREVAPRSRRSAVLTFVVDVSGSMAREDRLGLVKQSLRILLDGLRPSDRVGIVAYGSSAAVVLPHTDAENRDLVLSGIEALRPGGSTNAEEGLSLGYRLACAEYRQGHINRVMLCSDGVANVGRTGADGILGRIRRHADDGITLSAVGFGMGNYNDVLMERLGDRGNGHYAYVDTVTEAERLFRKNLVSTLEVVARDVKVQVEFNKDVVRSYRLMGYENRGMADREFRNDAADGGEVGAGHSATALYQLRLWPGKAGRVASVHLRYREPCGPAFREVVDEFWTSEIRSRHDRTSESYRLAATAARFAEILRNSPWARDGDLFALAERCGELVRLFDERDDVVELANLICKAAVLRGKSTAGSKVSRE